MNKLLLESLRGDEELFEGYMPRTFGMIRKSHLQDTTVGERVGQMLRNARADEKLEKIKKQNNGSLSRHYKTNKPIKPKKPKTTAPKKKEDEKPGPTASDIAAPGVVGMGIASMGLLVL